MFIATEHQQPIQLWSEHVRRREPSVIGCSILDQVNDLLDVTHFRLRIVIGNLIAYSAFQAGMTVDDVAQLVGVCRRTVENQAREAGFSSLKRVLLAAQFLQIYPVLYNSNGPYKVLLKQYGYSSLERLNKHCMQLTGYRAREIREQIVQPDELACLIAAILRKTR